MWEVGYPKSKTLCRQEAPHCVYDMLVGRARIGVPVVLVKHVFKI